MMGGKQKGGVDCCVIIPKKVQLYKLSSQTTVAEYEEAFKLAGF